MWKALFASAVVLVCLAVIAVTYVVPKIRVREQNSGNLEHVRVETPFGSVRVDAGKGSAPDDGSVPIYPGAKRERKGSGGANVDIDWGGGDKHISIGASEYTTADSVDQVRRWYRAQLPGWNTSDKEMVHIEGNLKRIVSIKERDGRTRIGIATIGEPAAN